MKVEKIKMNCFVLVHNSAHVETRIFINYITKLVINEESIY
jgi:hypothetical protein